MPAKKPEIHAVVEVAVPNHGSWVPLPHKPWPDYVRLYGSTPASEVSMLLAVTSSYGQSAEIDSAESLLERFPSILPGGLAVVAGERRVLPGCCCGLETWKEWNNVIASAQSPWTGHDPAPLVEVVGDEVHVWSDGGMGEKPTGESPVVFTFEEFLRAIDQVGKDLEDFINPLRHWLDAYAPNCAVGIVKKFETTFLRQ